VHADAELYVAGGVPSHIAERLRAETVGLAAVRWVGEVQGEEKARFFDGIDVLCVPSLDEPSGLTVIEAAMYGKAIVTTDHTGANYLVDDRNGKIVKAGSLESLTDALLAFAEMDAGALADFCAHSRERYLAAGTTDGERTAVLRMPQEVPAAPRVFRSILFDDQVPWFHETHYADGRRRLYLKNIRIWSGQGRGVVHV